MNATIVVKDANGVQKDSIQFNHTFKSDAITTLNSWYQKRENRSKVQKWLSYFGDAKAECYVGDVLKGTAIITINCFAGRDEVIAKNI